MACKYVVQSKGPYKSTSHRLLSAARKAAKARGGRIVKLCRGKNGQTIHDVKGVKRRKRR